MSIHIDASTQLAWAIANTEANLAGEKRIQPIHFFLGILKVIDPAFLQHLQGVDLPADAILDLSKLSKQVREYLEMSTDEITMYRRRIRKELRKGVQQHTDIQMLHRSDDSRAVFQKAVEKVLQSGDHVVSVMHLLETLYETGSITCDGIKKIHNRPSTQGARWEVVDDRQSGEGQSFGSWFGRNLSSLAVKDNLPPFVGRNAEIQKIIRTLSRTSKRNVAILGDPGVGKTALVEGLAKSLINGSLSANMKSSEILEIHGSDIAADCENEAALNKRIMYLFSVLHQHDTAILFLDDLQGLMPPHLKPEMALALLTTVLSDDHTPCIVTATAEHWDRLIMKEPSFARQFHVLTLESPAMNECREIAKAWAVHIGEIQRLIYTPEAVDAVVKASFDLPDDRALPDSIVDLLENAATYVKVSAMSSRSSRSEVGPRDVKSVLSEHYGIG